MKGLRLYFNDLGFDVASILEEDFLAKKRGSHFMVLKFTDYYFVKFVDTISLKKLKEEHSISIAKANEDFKLPKSLRLSIPNINTVFIVDGSVSNDVMSYVKHRDFNIVGGQQDSIFVLDANIENMYCAGKEYSHITGEAKLIWGSKKEFKTLNGHNRSFNLMTNLFNYLRY